MCNVFFMGKRAVRGPQETAAADFFAYTDRENRLYLWREGSGEPLLLTDHAFASEGEKPGIPYWEAWEYWEEWDETKGVWIRNEEKALQDYVDALDASSWERTCREQKITTFHRSDDPYKASGLQGIPDVP